MIRPRAKLHGRLVAVLAFAVAGCAELGVDPGLAGVLLGGPQGEESMSAGVREALRIGAERTVSQASRPGGFLDDPRVHIAFPEDLQPIANALRAVGLRSTVDEIETSMNRAAEQASGEAVDLLLDAVAALSIQDARAIVRGPDDAATRYFRTRTEGALRARFTPIVDSAMKRVGLYRSYEELLERNRLVSALGDPEFSLVGYVTDRTVDGLFSILREEERRIRDDPAARTTELLREVFGRG